MTLKEFENVLNKMNDSELEDFFLKVEKEHIIHWRPPYLNSLDHPRPGPKFNKNEKISLIVKAFDKHPEAEETLCLLLNLETEKIKNTNANVTRADMSVRKVKIAERALTRSTISIVVAIVAVGIAIAPWIIKLVTWIIKLNSGQ